MSGSGGERGGGWTLMSAGAFLGFIVQNIHTKLDRSVFRIIVQNRITIQYSTVQSLFKQIE